jgi:hypothetical protein
LAKRTDTSDTIENEDRGLTAAEAAELRRQLAARDSVIAAKDSELSATRKRARDAEFAGMSAQEQAIVSQQEACDSNITSITNEIDGYEALIAQLSDEPGNGKAVAEASRKMSRASAVLIQEEGRKDYLASQRDQVANRNKETREAAGRDDQQGSGRKMANGFPYDSFPAKTKAWVDAHPQAFTDKTYWDRVIRYAQEATQDIGLADESPEYFRHIEQKLGEVQSSRRAATDEEGDEGDENEEGDDLPEGQPQRRTEVNYVPEQRQERAAGPGSMAARPTRQVPQGNGQPARRGSIKLTSQEREAAESLYPNLPNVADRYTAYAEGKKFMTERQPGHFRN